VRFMVALLISLPLMGQSFADLSGEWRTSATAGVEAARPDYDDSSWPAVEMPLGMTKLPAGTWLRKSFEKPDRASVLILGLTGNYTLYLNGSRARPVASPNGDSDRAGVRPKVYPLPPGPGRITAAVHIDFTQFGPTAPYLDAGPYLAAPESWVVRALEDASARVRSRLGPYVLLAGFQTAQAFALLIVWFVSGRRYMALVWAALYVLYSGYNESSFFQDLPLRLHFLPPATLTCLALSIWRKDAQRWVVAVLVAWAILLFLPTSGQRISPWINLAAAAIVLLNVPKSKGAGRIAVVLLALYVEAPGWSILANRPLVFDSPAGTWPLLGIINVSFALAVILYFMRRFALDRRERQRLEGELEAARTVQQLLLPTPTEWSERFAVDAVYEPAQEVGGDFYFVDRASDRTLSIAIGDVSGKGLKAAMVVSMIIGALRNRRAQNPADILSELNAVLCAAGADRGFVTATLLRLEPEGGARLANAGHPAAYRGGIEVETGPGLPLGVVAGTAYEETAFRLDSELTLVSDGVIEAANAKGELFGFDRTTSVSRQSAREIAEAARAWGQNDDITVVTVRRTA